MSREGDKLHYNFSLQTQAFVHNDVLPHPHIIPTAEQKSRAPQNVAPCKITRAPRQNTRHAKLFAANLLLRKPNETQFHMDETATL